MGKPQRMSTFKLDIEWDEPWGNISTTNKCTMNGSTLTRETKVIGQDKEMTLKAEPKNGGVLLTHICGSVSATRQFIQ